MSPSWRARRLRADADAYADERLAVLEDTLARLLGTVERGRDLLSRGETGETGETGVAGWTGGTGDDVEIGASGRGE